MYLKVKDLLVVCAEGIVNNVFQILPKNFQEKLMVKINMRSSDFIFGYVGKLQYLCNKISTKRGKTYDESSQWNRTRKGIFDIHNNDEVFFKCEIAISLYCKEHSNHLDIVNSGF